jgi:hypothetical protein
MPTSIFEAQTEDPSSGGVVAVDPQPEGVYAHSPDHVERSVLQLIEIFRKPRNQEWLRTGVGQVQEIEDALWQLYTAFDLDTGVGAALDLVGGILGERRDGRADADYRAALRARILVNQSNGRIEDMIAVLLALDPAAIIQDREVYPAGIRFEVRSTFAGASERTMARMLRQAKPAGVRLTFVPVNTADTMIWSSPAGEWSTRGWGADWAGVL